MQAIAAPLAYDLHLPLGLRSPRLLPLALPPPPFLATSLKQPLKPFPPACDGKIPPGDGPVGGTGSIDQIRPAVLGSSGWENIRSLCHTGVTHLIKRLGSLSEFGVAQPARGTADSYLITQVPCLPRGWPSAFF